VKFITGDIVSSNVKQPGSILYSQNYNPSLPTSPLENAVLKENNSAMRTLLFAISVMSILFSSCRNTDSALPCNEITPDVAFETKVHETWCLPDESLKITIGTIVEDSRCNVKDIICVWAGRTVLELLIETKEVPFYRDTFYAVDNWQDAMTIGNYTLELTQVLPLERTDFVTDTAEYSFQLVLNEE
jgi:hypothetical protein